jgi:hypothetical protein
MIREERSEE